VRQFEDRKTQQAFADQHRTPTFSIETMTPWTTMDNHGKKRYVILPLWCARALQFLR
jgi:hypothetical protein